MELFDPFFQAGDANGLPLSGAKLYFYRANTTTPVTIYQDAAGATPHTNPVIADASGIFAPIYLDTIYSLKTVLKTSADVTVQTVSSFNPDGVADGAVTEPKLGTTLRAQLEPTFDTLSDAESYAPAVAPKSILLRGYLAIGDGGQFRAVQADPDSDPGHGSAFMITLADTVTDVWYVNDAMATDGKLVDARQFGIFGDTTTPYATVAANASATSVSAALQDMLDACANRPVWFGPGIHVIDATAFVSEGTQVYAYDATFLIKDGAAATVYGFFFTDATWLVPSHKVQWRGGIIDGNRANRTPPGSAALVYPWQCEDIVLEDMIIRNSMSDNLYCGGEIFAGPDLISSAAGVNGYGTSQGGTSTTIILEANAGTDDDIFNTRYIAITDGAGRGQVREVTDFVASTDTCTVSPAWDILPNSGDLYQLSFTNTRAGVAKRWRVRNVVCENGYRNNLSIVGADMCVFENCQWNGANGASPEMGVDWEADHRAGINTDCLMIMCRADNNDSHGFGEGSAYNYRCYVDKCSASGNGGWGFLFGTGGPNVVDTNNGGVGNTSGLSGP